MWPLASSASYPRSSRNGGVRCKALVADLREGANFAPLVCEVEAASRYVHAFRNSLMQLIPSFGMEGAVDHCPPLQRTDHELCPCSPGVGGRVDWLG